MRNWQSFGFGIAVVFVSTVLMASTVNIFSFAAPSNRTGAPGEATCADGCHSDFPINSGAGSVVIETADAYSPNEILNVTVRVSDPVASRYGFSMTAIDATETYVGSWDVSGEDVQLAGGSTDHISHKESPILAGVESVEWSIPWTAPAIDVGTVSFYATGNGANGDGTRDGDNIYSVSLDVLSRGSSSTREDELPTDFAIQSVFPNPFSERVSIVATLERPKNVTIDLFDLTGRLIQSNTLGLVSSGMHEWSIRGNGLSAGMLIYRIRADREIRSGVLILSR